MNCNNNILIPVAWERETSRGYSRFTELGQLEGEGLFWLNKNLLLEKESLLVENAKENLQKIIGLETAILVNTNWKSTSEWEEQFKKINRKKKRVHLLALGDVGSTILTALKLLGGDCIETLGIFDVNQNVCKRWESELNQATYPWEYSTLPEVVILEETELFDCDVFIFCASKGIPPLDTEVQDVRMAQFEANRGIISMFAKKARESKFQGLFAVVSDPVDPLCKEVFLSSNQDENGVFDGQGLLPEQIQGYGLGVMNGRAMYYAKKDSHFSSFLREGRAYGPHGDDLVIANSIENYDEVLSNELTTLAIEANLKTRELGFKPYVAPAISSAALSILLTIRGEWHYSSNFLGGVFMGCKNRTTAYGIELESVKMPEILYKKIEKAYCGLEAIL